MNPSPQPGQSSSKEMRSAKFLITATPQEYDAGEGPSCSKEKGEKYHKKAPAGCFQVQPAVPVFSSTLVSVQYQN